MNIKSHNSFLLIAVSFVLLTACNNSKLNLPIKEDIATATIREYRNGTPVSREITLNKDSIGFLDAFIRSKDYGKYKEYKKTIKKSVNDVPIVEKSLKIRLELVSEEIRTFYIYEIGDKEYIEEPHFGIYKRLSRVNGLYHSLTRTHFIDKYDYLYISLSDAFGKNNYETFDWNNYSILPEYNGAGKAIWIELYKEDVEVENLISTEAEVKNNPFYNSRRNIPTARQADRAEDVRYIVVRFVSGRYKSGDWYVFGTGKHVREQYDYNSIIEVYDLVKRNTVSMESINGIEEYFSRVE